MTDPYWSYRVVPTPLPSCGQPGYAVSAEIDGRGEIAADLDISFCLATLLALDLRSQGFQAWAVQPDRRSDVATVAVSELPLRPVKCPYCSKRVTRKMLEVRYDA